MTITRDELLEVASDLREVQQQMQDLVDQARRVLRRVGGTIHHRAEAYWLAHITTALSNDHGYLGGSMQTLEDTIDEIEELANDDDEQPE